MAWSPHIPDLLTVCTSTGLLVLYVVTSNGIQRITNIRVCEPSILVLDLEFHPSDPSTIGITLSDGRVCLVHLEPSFISSLESLSRTDHNAHDALFSMTDLASHSLEAWTLFFPPPPTQGLYSGGDDATLLFSPPPAINDSVPTNSAHPTVWKDSKTHAAGVTALLPLITQAPSTPILVTGSYDDRIRVLRLPTASTPRPAVLAELDLGGGVWRLELIRRHIVPESRQQTHFILASCMHAGCRVVAVTDTIGSAVGLAASWDIRVVAGFTEHKSMNYASCVYALRDPSVESTSAGHVTIVSTSFYDKLMCLWSCELL